MTAERSTWKMAPLTGEGGGDTAALESRWAHRRRGPGAGVMRSAVLLSGGTVLEASPGCLLIHHPDAIRGQGSPHHSPTQVWDPGLF